MKTEAAPPNLRDRQLATTRQAILDIAMEMLARGVDHGFSHEAIAAEAGMSARTVYRHFPDRTQLLQALWVQLRERTKTRFPEQPDEISALMRTAFAEFDRNEPLIRTLLNSEAGTAVRERGAAEGRPAFARTLKPLLAKRTAREQARIVAVFLGIYSAPFWQLLRDRGGLSGAEAQEAAAWTLQTLLEALRKPHAKGD